MRPLVLLPLVLAAGACGDDPAPTQPPAADGPAPVVEGDPMDGPPPPPMTWAEAERLCRDVTRWDAASTRDRRAALEAVDVHLEAFSLLDFELFEAGDVAHEVGLFVHDPTGLEFALVPGGRFTMGSLPGEVNRAEGGGPLSEIAHDVVLSRGFLVCRTELDQRAWRAVMGTNPSHFEDEFRPVENVAWTEAQDFCTRTGLALPTEAQWEYACRAGTRTAYCFGDDVADLPAYAHYDGNAENTTHRVGKKRPNAFGLHDLHGNVMEWCLDGDGEYPEGAAEDPLLGADSANRILRGGSWYNAPAYARSAARSAQPPGTQSQAVGFRPVAPLPR